MEIQQIKGEIGHHGLQEWWFHELSESDRELILSTYRPLGMSPDAPSSLIHGDIYFSSANTASWLTVLAGWFMGAAPGKRELAIRIADKAWELKDKPGPSQGADNVFSRHLALGGMMKIYYRHRDKPEHFNRAVECALLQIAMQEDAMQAWLEQEANRLARLQLYTPDYVTPSPSTPPEHPGYKQMAILLEKEKRFHEALNLVLEAQAAEWQGDWEKRIERLQKKLR